MLRLGMANYILAIDQGTTSSRAVLFDQSGRLVDIAQEEFRQYFPQDGWVEHNPEDIWDSTVRTFKAVLSQQNLTARDIAAIGITNQRETTLLWDKTTGKTIYNAIVWQDRRTGDYCDSLKSQGIEDSVTAKTGLLLDPYFSATKLKWLLDHVAGARDMARQGKLAFGTVDCFLLWRLTGGRSHKTDATNASRTLLFNIHTQCWDEMLLAQFDVPANILPEVLDSSANFGLTDEALFGAAIPITGMAGDQQLLQVWQEISSVPCLVNVVLSPAC